jgi:hypothetical protein
VSAVNQANGTPASMARPIIAWACRGSAGELDVAGDARCAAPVLVLGPGLRQVQLAAGQRVPRAPTHTPGTPRPGSRGTDPQIIRICTITYGAVTSQATEQIGGYRVTAATSDRHAARLLF